MAVIAQAQSEVVAAVGLTDPLTAWHLLSLDAPTVAVVWMAFLGRVQGVRVPGVELLALFTAVWLLYAGDRLLDGRDRERGLTARHYFHREHARRFLYGMVLASFGLAALLFRLPHADLAWEAGLATVLLLYFAAVHLTGLAIPKEICTAVFFSLAIVMPSFTRTGCFNLWAVLAFALLCVANGLYISAWEGAERSPVPMILCAGLVFWGLMQPNAALGASGAAALVLLGLDRWRGRFPATVVRAAADLALLSPLLFWFWRV